MHRFFRIAMSLWLIFTLLTGSISALGETAMIQTPIEMFAVNVGKGDAIFLRAGDYCCLIDAGYTYTRGKVLAAMDYMAIDHLDAIFLTHTDSDHGDGLEWLARSDIPIDQWYASAIFTGVKEKKHPAVKAAAIRDCDVTWLRRGDHIPLGDSGAVFEVLAPAALNTDKDNNNSLVMMLESAEGRILLTGDMELVQESQLMALGNDLTCDILKIANHADDDTTGEAFLKAAAPDMAIISTSTEAKPETPDPGVLSRIRAVGASCHVTQEGEMGLYITLCHNNAACQTVDFSSPVQNLEIREVMPGDDVIVLYNPQPEPVDLSGWYLFSDKGKEMYVFPEGRQISGESRLIIGSLSASESDIDLTWPEKKVIHTSKTDNITLYDRWGREIDRLSNGY